MELIHSHIVRRPAPPHNRMASVPEQISSIVMKLLAKTPEERYQTAGGVEADLSRCLTEWESLGRIGPFTLGAHEPSDRLVMGETLYGRDRELGTLVKSFEVVATTGAAALILVSGDAGIGKSAVVKHSQTKISSHGGLFISGKFDQYRHDIPYAVIATAFQNLIKHILGESDAEAERWRRAIQAALGPNAQLRTLSYSLNPNYSNGNQPVIIGYTASNTVEARLSDLSLIGRTIDTGIQAGANRVQGLQFGLKDDQPVRLQALKLATVEAKAHADAMASGLGLKTGAPVAIQEGSTISIQPLRLGNAAPTAATPIETGSVDIRATVTLQVELAP